MDYVAVQALYTRLKRDSIDPWLDKENLLPGQNWESEIHSAILQCDVVVVCLSREFNKHNGFRYEELKLALKKASVLPTEVIFIIPVRLEKCDMPDSLRHLHRVDLFEEDGYKKLLQALRYLLKIRKG
jgi:hypothetical protein